VWPRGGDSKLPPDSRNLEPPMGCVVVGDQALRPSHIQSAAPAFKGFEKNADQHWRPMGAGHARLRPSCPDAAFLGRRPFISLLPFTAPLGKLIIPWSRGKKSKLKFFPSQIRGVPNKATPPRLQEYWGPGFAIPPVPSCSAFSSQAPRPLPIGSGWRVLVGLAGPKIFVL
jgi:hypothetical protein